MTGATIYARISKDAGTGLGVARQEADCRALCERRGWDVTEVIVDNDVSAYSRRGRPGYRRLLAAIEARSTDVVVVWHPDRLHRSPVELEGFIDLVEATGITVTAVTSGDYDLSTPEGRLTARIVGSVARKESEDKSRRLRRKHQELAEVGKVSGGGRRPFGYEPDRVTIREAEAAEIRAAAARILAGESLRSIATDWRARGVATVTGAEWAPTTIRRLLGSGRIAGLREHHGAIVGTATWPAIIDPDDAAKVRAILRSPGSAPGAVTARSYLLTGFLFCGREGCGARMTTAAVIRKGHRYRRYVCSVDRGGCGRCGISADGIEAMVVDDVLDVLDTPALAAAMTAADPGADPIDEVAEVEGRMAELAEMFAAGEIGRAEWSTARDALARRLDDTRQAVAADAKSAGVAATVGDVTTLRDRWPGLTLEQRRAVIDVVIERIEVAPTTRAGNRFNPDRAAITWKV